MWLMIKMIDNRMTILVVINKWPMVRNNIDHLVERLIPSLEVPIVVIQIEYNAIMPVVLCIWKIDMSTRPRVWLKRWRHHTPSLLLRKTVRVFIIYKVYHILVYSDTSANIMNSSAFKKIGINGDRLKHLVHH